MDVKITAYGDRLLEDLDELDWPESLKICNVTGSVVLKVQKYTSTSMVQTKFTVFTTRPDTLFGATYCVLAPEHALVAEITTAEQKKR